MISSNRQYRGNDLVLGTTAGSAKVIWNEKQRRTHMYVSGTTGSGKSRFTLSLIQQDLEQHWKSKQGLLLLDPHSELYDDLVAYLAQHRRPAQGGGNHE